MGQNKIDHSHLQLSNTCFKEFIRVVHSITGITLDKNRKPMLIGRLRKRVATLHLNSYEDYLEYLSANKEEQAHFINQITTNETYCYRTPRVWDFFANELLANTAPGKTLNVWSAAASTGEEAHTAAILCHHFQRSHNDFRYRILGTDIAPSVIETATKGLYTGKSIKRFREAQPELFSQYMQGSDDQGYTVLPDIKANIRFKTHNLFNTLRGEQKDDKHFDLILLRNVLIYFSRQDQERVLANIHQQLAPNGFLIIGESESIARLNTDFVLERPLVYQSRHTKREHAA